MKIGIIGAGNVGTAIGKLLTRRDHEVLLSFSKTTDDLANAARAVGGNVQTGSVAEAAAFGDVVVLSCWEWEAESECLFSASPPDAAAKRVVSSRAT
jgi:8-hydroxy-5-deazaflavin:NADPH oxidoreductase